MDLGKVIEGGAEMHPSSSRTVEGSRPLSLPGNLHDSQQSRAPGNVWAGAVSRLQTQVSYNTSMLESHRRQIADVEQAIGRLQGEMGNVHGMLSEIRAELRARPANVEPVRHDSGDLDVLAGQIASVTNKANEVDGLRMQVELMKNRIRRFEEQGSPSAAGQRPGTSSTHHELYEATPAPHQQPPPHPSLPPMRTGSAMSPPGERLHGMHAPPVLLSQGSASFHPPPEPRTLPSEHPSTQSSAPGFRIAEPLPPPSSLSGWRPAESHPIAGLPPPPPPSAQYRMHGMEVEPQTSGWAAVNVNQPLKRPFDEQRPSPYGPSSAPGSPKRPKLAPIMPRSSYGDESFVPTPSSMQQTAVTATPEGLFHQRGRAPSDPSQLQSQSLPTPASANTSSYRFITSTAQADSQESWRPESERMQHVHHPPGPPGPQGPPGRGRGRRGGGRGRGRGSRGGAHHPPEVEELGTPAWEKPDWTGSQISPNGYYDPMHPHRGGLVRRSGGAAGGPSDREHEYPATPVQGPHDYAAAQAEALDSAGKKSRTKPIRNAEGVLIRKDGRPDMRSVSSANNLRKVHAKKEAERAEMEGRTPTSARSLAPAHSTSLSEDDERRTRSGTPGSASAADEQDTQERHQELMARIFPHGVDNPGHRGMAGNYFPHRDEPTSVPETIMKTEESDEQVERRQGDGHGDSQMTDTRYEDRSGDSQMADTVMREMSDAQAEEQAAGQQQQDMKMPPIREQMGDGMAAEQEAPAAGQPAPPPA